MATSISRRAFLAACGTAAAVSLLPARAAHALRSHGPHPVPRPGITGAKVATHEQLGTKTKLFDLFDGVRDIPQIVDGIRCNCGCAHTEGFYSLLTCYEGEGAMAKECTICQGQGRLAVRLAKAGKTLDEIRAAVDARYS